MEDVRLAYMMDGHTYVIHPTAEFLSHPDSTLAKLVSQTIPKGREFHVIDPKNLPTDRYFRNAWHCASGVVGVNMDKARDIHLEHLRAKRNEKLRAMDVQFQRALETKDELSQAEIAAKKQALRDMPSTVDLNTLPTLEEIKACVPDILA
jgi:hypothetical protein